MKKMSFIIRLKRSYEAFQSDMEDARKTPFPEYLRFLKTLEFYTFVEHVITACVRYPRSIECCRDGLRDLSDSMWNEVGMGRFYLSHIDLKRLSRLIEDVGTEVIGCLEGAGFYYDENQLSRRRSRDFETELVAIPDIEKINRFTFKVEVIEYLNDEEIEEIPVQTPVRLLLNRWSH